MCKEKKGREKKTNNIITLVILYRNNRNQCEKCRHEKNARVKIRQHPFSL